MSVDTSIEECERRDVGLVVNYKHTTRCHQIILTLNPFYFYCSTVKTNILSGYTIYACAHLWPCLNHGREATIAACWILSCSTDNHFNAAIHHSSCRTSPRCQIKNKLNKTRWSWEKHDVLHSKSPSISCHVMQH